MSEQAFIEKVGKRIKKARIERGYSQQVLADKCEVEKANISRIESGKVNLKILTLRKIAQALRVPLKDVIA
ncbi:MAG: helix-turn-helix domain-containing protein [Chitinophagaceae bacterium]|jgi:transcriptional regulator with XRE-family HTH domain